jgi:hypothetical protein
MSHHDPAAKIPYLRILSREKETEKKLGGLETFQSLAALLEKKHIVCI